MALPQPLFIGIKRGPTSSTLTVRRADGSSTWSKLSAGIELHDIAHYAVEQTLGLEQAFYGLLAEGFDISDFELAKAERPVRLQTANLPPESIQTEHLINLLMTELQYGGPLPDFMTQFTTILRQHGLPPMHQLTNEGLEEIRKRLAILKNRWSAVAVGEVLELRFE
ncbi:MAG: hypothetical protein AB8H12_01960 [Lewinella sp.]